MGRARIGVIGTGMMGRALVELLTRNAHEVGIGSRDLARAEDVARATPNAWAGRYSDVAAASDVLFWAVAWDYAESTLKTLPDLRRAVLVDCSNPETPDGRGLAVGLDTSGAETIATLRPDARVIKAFCHTYAELLRKGPEFG